MQCGLQFRSEQHAWITTCKQRFFYPPRSLALTPKKIKGELTYSSREKKISRVLFNARTTFFFKAFLAERGGIYHTKKSIGIISFHVSCMHMPECLMNNTSQSIADSTAGAEETAATETAEKGWPNAQTKSRRGTVCAQ
jgi:hypothetical protein